MPGHYFFIQAIDTHCQQAIMTTTATKKGQQKMIKVLKAVGLAVAAAPFAVMGAIVAGPAGVAVVTTTAVAVLALELID